MSAPHRRTASLLVVLLTMGVLTAFPASAEEFASFGCFADPGGDAGGVDIADIVGTCLQYPDTDPSAEFPQGEPIRLTTVFAAGNNPLQDASWSNDDTALQVALSTDGDAAPELVLRLFHDGNSLVRSITDGSGGPVAACDAQVELDPSFQGIDFVLQPSCIPDSPDVRYSVQMTYEQTEGAAVAMDRWPDSDASVRMPRGDENPFCDVPSETGVEVVVARVACGIGGTEPVSQAVAISQFVFNDLSTLEFEPYTGQWAVIVRDDNFADALAGSSLGFGQGPLLFTYSPTSGPALGQDHTRLAAATKQELIRTVPRGFPVYVLGGTAAIDEGVMDHLRELGYDAQRLSGPTRVDTAAAVALEVRRRTQDFAARNPGFPDTNMVLMANQDNWPDAVLAGQVGALWGFPVLLTGATGDAPAATLAALDALRPQAIQFIGGQTVISSDTLRSIREYANTGGYAFGGPGAELTDDTSNPWRQFCANSNPDGTQTPRWTCRWGGDTRIATGAAVSQFGREMIQRFGGEDTLIPDTEVYASGVALGGGRDSDNYAYVLAASMMSGRFGGAVFLPTDNNTLTDTVIQSVCDIRRGKDTNGDGEPDTPFIEFVELVALMADTDKLSDEFGEEIRSLISDGCPATFATAAPDLVAAD
ncbi:cell wall-binding repeat-containing protein [Euzebya rosea]|uniref:cell wall-binding repeat-containing protein n=1 Tax=Euzebya rosea TaxID=2052804 RepID=UPI000D3E1D7D|nr:cell wall-binding repeat-containing protein [Euzebya rosea]